MLPCSVVQAVYLERMVAHAVEMPAFRIFWGNILCFICCMLLREKTSLLYMHYTGIVGIDPKC